jgi:hypothetical protein
MTHYPYIEKCAETVAAINATDISANVRGKELGASLNGGYTVYALGSVTLEERLHLAVKVSKKKDPLDRLAEEVAAIDEIMRRAPSLQDKMPVFIGLLAVGNSDNPVSIITEDATAGGSLPIYPMRASSGAVEELKRGFGDEAEEAVEDIELDNSVAFDVGGSERWLDFTPSPVYLNASLSDPITAVKNEVRNRQDELTVVIADGSALARSLQAV